LLNAATVGLLRHGARPAEPPGPYERCVPSGEVNDVEVVLQAKHRLALRVSLKRLKVHGVGLNQGSFGSGKRSLHARRMVFAQRPSSQSKVLLHLHEVVLHFGCSSIVFSAVQPRMEPLHHVLMAVVQRANLPPKSITPPAHGVLPCRFVRGFVQPVTHQRTPAGAAVTKDPWVTSQGGTEVEDQPVSSVSIAFEGEFVQVAMTDKAEAPVRA